MKGQGQAIYNLHKSGKSIQEIMAMLKVSESGTRKAIAKYSKIDTPVTSPEPSVSNNSAPELLISEEDAEELMDAVDYKPADKTLPEKQDKIVESLMEDILTPKPTHKLSNFKTPVLSPKVHFQKEDTPEETASIISRIHMNIDNFEPLLQNVLVPNKEQFLASIQRKSLRELKMTLKLIEDTRIIGTASIQMKNMLVVGAQFTELATSKIGIRSQGFAQNILSQEEEITMVLRELALERVDSLRNIQRPEMRLAMLFSMTLLATDQANRLKDAKMEAPVSDSDIQPPTNNESTEHPDIRPAIAPKSVSTEVKEKYSDL